MHEEFKIAGIHRSYADGLQLERQMADEDDDFDEDDEDDNFPSNRKRRNSSTGSEKSRSKSPKRR